MRCLLSALLSGLVVAGLIGCAAPQTEQILQSSIARPQAVELTDVPFFPQEKYYCGPASLATLLAWNKLQITPDDLVAEVYTPGRKGTFTADIVAAAPPINRGRSMLPSGVRRAPYHVHYRPRGSDYVVWQVQTDGDANHEN